MKQSSVVIGITLVVAFATSSRAASIGLALQPPVGLSDEEGRAIGMKLAAELGALGADVKATSAIEGCAGDSACVERVRLALSEPVDGLVMIELVRVGAETQVSTTAAAGDLQLNVSHSVAGRQAEVVWLGDDVIAWARAVVAAHPAVVAVPTAAPASAVAPQTLAERGGLFGLGLVVAPKIGGALGSVLLEGAGATFAGELEVGYALPLSLPRGHDLEIFTAWGYSAPSSTATLKDARVPSGTAGYTLTLHTLGGSTGLLYRLPIDAVEWWRLYGAVGVQTQWSWSVIEGSAGGEAFSAYVESAFDVGLYAAVGSDFMVGPGAVLVELQSETVSADRFVQRQTTNAALQLVVGYRFFL